jgi:hypothetical protein
MNRSFRSAVVRAAASLAFVTVAGHAAGAQAKGAAGAFSVGYTDIGPTLGLGGINGASASFGGRFEHGFKALPNFANGTLGIGVSADYYSFSNSVFSYKYIPVGVTANYHFKLDDPKIDPFIGAGLGYQIITCDVSGVSNIGCSNSAIYFIGHLGARYFIAPSMAAYADVGAGAATLNIGLMFKLH